MRFLACERDYFFNELQGVALRELKNKFFHELPYGHELQSKALHYGNITMRNAKIHAPEKRNSRKA